MFSRVLPFKRGAGMALRLAVVSAFSVMPMGAQYAHGDTGVEFGANRGERAFDGVCDDPRFVALEESDKADGRHLFQDAADCHAAYREGHVALRTDLASLYDPVPVDGLGADSGVWALDGVCNDPRFAAHPRHMSAVEPKDDALGKDATDCHFGYLIRQAWPTWEWDGVHIVLGDDSGPWAHDGECDDPRFIGRGMGSVPTVENMLRDATDCKKGLEGENVKLSSPALLEETAKALGLLPSGVGLGDDGGSWAFDGECDDPRFTGESSAPLLEEEDARHDATDCGKALLSGSVEYRDKCEGSNRGRVDSREYALDGECDEPEYCPHGADTGDRGMRTQAVEEDG